MTLLATLAFNAVVLAVIYLVLNRKIDKQITPEAFLEKVRSEIQSVMVELNETTDRNITLLEERVRSLQAVLKRADKKLSMLQSETTKQRDTSEVYTHLRRAGKIVAGRQAESGEAEQVRREQPQPEEGARRGGKRDEPADLPVEQRVVNLYKQGVAPEMIAGRLERSIGEVELIISLYERKEWA